MISEYLECIQQIKDTKLSQETLGFIGSGNLYVYGKCKDECTNVYFCMNPKIRSVELNEFLGLTKFFLVLIRNMCCVPGYLERFNIIINLKDSEASKVFMMQFIDKLRYLLVRTLPYSINRIIFFGDISQFEEKVKEFSTKMKSFCEVSHFQDNVLVSVGANLGLPGGITAIIDKDQLEKKFGGDRPDLEEYWPPTHHTAPGESIDEEDLGKVRVVPFFIYDEDVEQFVQNHIPQEVKIDKIPGGHSKYLRRNSKEGGVRIQGTRSIPDTMTKANEDIHVISKQHVGGTPKAQAHEDHKNFYEAQQKEVSLFQDFEDNNRQYSFKAKELSKNRGPSKQSETGLFKLLGCCGDR